MNLRGLMAAIVPRAETRTSYIARVDGMTAADLTPQEIAAALAARRELGPEYEDPIAASLADRVEREIAARVGPANNLAALPQAFTCAH